MYKKMFYFLICFLLINNFVFALGTTTATTSKKIYKLPKEGLRVKNSEANFSFFPEKLFFQPGKNIFLVSRKWQTACLYNIKGELDKTYCVQTSTGKKEFPTELGLYNIQTKYGKDYKSTLYSSSGSKIKDKKDGAPMPYAMHIGRIIGIGPDNELWYDFSDGTAIHEKQTINKFGSVSFVSHGCIALEKNVGKSLQSILDYGDLVLVFNENIPESLEKMIAITQ